MLREQKCEVFQEKKNESAVVKKFAPQFYIVYCKKCSCIKAAIRV